MTKKPAETDKDNIPLSSYSPPPFKVKNPAVQTTHPKYGGHGPISKSRAAPDKDNG